MSDATHSRHLLSQAPVGRRGMLVQLSGLLLAATGLSAFRRGRVGGAGDAGPVWDDRFELAVDLEIAPQEGARYHRPYVAVWVEDATGRPVRTLSLWVNTTGRGPRYIRELRRWMSGVDGASQDLIATTSSATRLPGQYSVTWNGRDDRGQPVLQGTYRVYIEASREHGGYGVMQQELALGARPVAADLGTNEEIRRAHVEYRRRR
ncbi:MAG: DUF2271 domain-containing protein [Gemmatimonadaceae bacterium]|nr:DUF2271 domain-containing protein [Gemmatimonadaceae bacterium]